MGKISLSKNEILPQDSYHLKTSYYSLLVERNQVLLPLRNFTKSIPDELVINEDQTPSKFVATDNITIAAKGQKHISRAGSSDIRSITLTVCESLDGKSLPFQLIYKGKTQDCSQLLISPMVFVYCTMENIGVTRRRLSVLLRRSW